MSKTSIIFTISSMLLLAVSLSVLELNKTADWQVYQERYFTAQVATLRTELTNAKEYKIKGQIESEIAQLNTRKPQIVNLVLPNGKIERCQTCHLGIEEISTSHPAESFGCTVCHGGNPLSLDTKTAHAGWFGDGHPGKLQFVNLTCGGTAPNGSNCHSGNANMAKNQVDLVKTSLMSTKAGELSVVRRTFGLKDKDITSGGTASQVPSPLDGGTREHGFVNNCLTQCHQMGGVLPSFANKSSSSGTSSNANGCEVCHVLS
ncbi:MAG TPA: hypothetical protein VFF14_01640, partial [Candidatus Deferrimicrobium sp.]|nr:hypothetical protein [Candidatus Deferrimicrobium sp.]